MNFEYGSFQNDPNPKITIAGTTPAHKICAIQWNNIFNLLAYTHPPVKYNKSYLVHFRAMNPYINPNPTECKIHKANIEVCISTELIVDPQILLRFDRSTGSKGVFFERMANIINGIIVRQMWIEMQIAKWKAFFSFNKHPKVL